MSNNSYGLELLTLALIQKNIHLFFLNLSDAFWFWSPKGNTSTDLKFTNYYYKNFKKTPTNHNKIFVCV